MALWGEYQSLFQLSVALNTALAAISDFLGNAPRSGASEARRLAERAEDFQKIDPENAAAYPEIITDFTLAESHYQDIYDTYNSYVRKLRPLCIIVALLSTAGLIRSSINYTHEIRGLWLIFSYIQLAPVMIGATFFAIYLSVISIRTPNRKLRDGIQKLRERESDLTKRRQGGGVNARSSR